MRPRTVIVVLFYALMSAYAAVNAYQTMRLNRSYPGWEAQRQGGRLTITRVQGVGVGAGLRPRDEVVSIDGRPSKSVAASSVYGLAPGTPYTMTVRRDGADTDFAVRTEPVPWSRWVMLLALAVLLPAVTFSTGFAVFLLRPDDKQALVLALLFAVLIPPMAAGWREGLPAALAFLLYVGPLITPLAFVILLHLFLVFPEPSPLLRRYPRLEWLIYLPYSAPFVVRNVVVWTGAGRGLLPLLDTLALLAVNVYTLAALASLVVTYRRAGVLARRRLRVVLAGMAAGMLPGVLVFFTLPVFGLYGLGPSVTEWLMVAGALAFPLMPLSFAYAIARHQVIPVSLIVRRSVQYLLAKNALRVLLALPAAGLVLSVARDPHRSVADVLLRNSTYFYALALAAVALGLVFRRRLDDWIDRKFFREQFDEEKILRGLVEEIKGLDSIGEMSRRVSEQVERAVHPESVYLFYREHDRGELSLTYTSGGASSAGQELRIPEDSQLLRLLELHGGAQDFPFPPKTRLPPGEKEWLASLGTRLIVPLTGTDERLAGLFLLGGKKSEVPYTSRDRELLESVAAQIAVVYENVRLKERAREDKRVRQEVLSRFEGRGVNLLKECPACGRCFDSTSARCDRDGAQLQLTLPVERTVEGRYRLERLVGRGGMGAVYEATHLALRSRVAVKILSGRLFGDDGALRRFAREARALARLGQHPNVVSVHDYGELQTEGAFLVMDFIEGESLAALLRRERRLTPGRAAALFGQVLEGVAAAHRQGIVHRDLKPENIVVSPPHEGAGEPRVRLLDFGLAKVVRAEGSEPPTMTTPGVVMGTFGYMPPEQLAGGEVDERSDLFSVGVMCAEALVGERPFRGRTPVELLHSMEREDFRLPGDAPEVRRLEEVLRRALARERARRHASAEEMRGELLAALGDCPALHAPAAPAPEADTVRLRDRPAPSL